MRMIGFINPTLRQIEAELLASQEIEFVSAHTVEDLRAKAVGAAAALVSNSTYDGAAAEILRSVADLRWIQATSIGIESLAAHPPRQDVIVTNAAGLKAPTVAEHAVMLLLALFRNLPRAIDFQRSSRWATRELAPEVRSLAGKRIICLGYGAIGRDVARKLAAFDAEVIAVTRSGNGPPPAVRVLAYDRLREVLPGADAVILALPLVDETRHIIGKNELALMKPTSLLVNVGRGELVDDRALATALTERRLGGAGLDVFSSEPLSEQSPLWKCPNAVLTPHLGGQGGQGDSLLVRLVHENAARLKRGEALANVVTVA
jgi:phosphoglycerate dehydrogenase-like enzyme